MRVGSTRKGNPPQLNMPGFSGVRGALELLPLLCDALNMHLRAVAQQLLMEVRPTRPAADLQQKVSFVASRPLHIHWKSSS